MYEGPSVGLPPCRPTAHGWRMAVPTPHPTVLPPAWPSLSATRWLDGDDRPEGLGRNRDVAGFLQARAVAARRGRPVYGPSPRGDARLARQIAHEAEASIARDGGRARDWYARSVPAALRVLALLHPEIDDPDAARRTPLGTPLAARTALLLAVAVTSQGVSVEENLRAALDRYRHLLRTGRYDERGHGTAGPSVAGNLARLNDLLDAGHGFESMAEVFGSTVTMRDLVAAAADAGVRVPAHEPLDESVRGAALLGPKIGAFYLNLTGDRSVLTVDMWLMRTWGRMTGTLVRPAPPEGAVDRFLTALATTDDHGLDADALGALDGSDTRSLATAAHDLTRRWETRRARMRRSGASREDVVRAKHEAGWPAPAAALHDALSGTVDVPTRPSQRPWMRSVMRRALAILESRGHDMELGDLQAALWYPEKDLWDTLAGRRPGSLTIGYDDAAAKVAVERGVDHGIVRDARREHGADHAPHGAGRGPGAARGGAGPCGAGGVREDVREPSRQVEGQGEREPVLTTPLPFPG